MSSACGDVAIIGMGCIFPGAKDVRSYWQNIVAKVDAVSEPPEGWETGEDSKSGLNGDNGIYCKRGGYLGDLARFNPAKYGVMPTSVDGGEPDQFLALAVAYDALEDAGCLEKELDRRRAGVVIGKGTYVNRGNATVLQHGLVIGQTLQILKQLHPELTDAELQAVKKELKAGLPPFNAEVSPGFLPNITAGRIANRFDFMGPSYTVDAACASSLIAVEMGIRELLTGKCDLMLAGGVNASMPPPILMVFCQLNALSRRGNIRPFDKESDGTLLGEGAGIVVLKRREDAERDGDRIYALIRGVGTASDGRALGLFAPRVEGEEMALRRAYDVAGVSPSSVGLIEAHGTGTMVGDVTEIQALTRIFGRRSGEPWCAIGTVKSMISHLIPAAGIAGLIKTALALHHKVLPPTINCDEPNPKLEIEKTPFYINTETRPWIHGGVEPRRAGINAFGFGGINAHAVLEEHRADEGGIRAESPTLLHRQWDTEVFIIQEDSKEELIRAGRAVCNFLSRASTMELKDLAYTLNCGQRDSGYKLSIVADSREDLAKKLDYALQRLADTDCKKIKDRSGIYFFEEPLGREGGMAFLFPGEGAQYVNMLSDLCIHFPEVRACFDRTDRAFLNNKSDVIPSRILFPPPLSQSSVTGLSEQLLWRMDTAVALVFSANHALSTLFEQLEIRPHAVAGHSSGEFAALLASGVLNIKNEAEIIDNALELIRIYESLSDQIPEARLMTVGALDQSILNSLMAESDGTLCLAMDNCPYQVILCGTEGAIRSAYDKLQQRGAVCNILPFNRAYHTPLFKPVCDRFYPFFESLEIVPPSTPIYSCATTLPYPENPDEIRRLAVGQWGLPVRFRETVEAMYDDGIRIFVEVGPRGNLTSFVDDILKDRRYIAVPANVQHRSGITQINHLIGMLAAHGVQMRLDYLYKRRSPVRLSLDALGGLQSAEMEINDGSVRLVLNLPRMKLSSLPSFKGEQTAGSTISPPFLKGGSIGSHNVQSQVMQEYFQNMEQFLSSQQEVMKAFVKIRPKGTVPDGLKALRGPFSINISSIIPGQEVVATCRLDIEEDLFLRDHALGRNPSTHDKTLAALPVVPLTVSSELMAQVGHILVPDKRLISMRNVRTHKWTTVESGSRVVWVIARRNSSSTLSDDIEVKVVESDGLDAPGFNNSNILVEGTMVYGNEYPVSPAAETLALKSERPYLLLKSDEYYKKHMFHGPTFQGVVSLDRIGDDGIEATIKEPEGAQLSRSDDGSRLFTSPILLDEAGQLIGFWAWDCFDEGSVVFPTGFDALYIYDRPPYKGEMFKCYARVTLSDNRLVRADIDIVRPGGRVCMRLIGWQDIRFFGWTRQFIKFCTFSARDIMLSTPWPSPLTESQYNAGFRCCRLSESADGIWLQVLAYMILNRKEREEWLRMTGPDKRRKEWLLGRMAAKDAVRLLLNDLYKKDLSPADIEITTDKYGRPVAGGDLLISITHSGGEAAAVACVSGNNSGVGIDMEHVARGHDGLEGIALIPDEQGLLFNIPPASKGEWLLRFWCAKEAIAKALGRGMMGGPTNLVVKGIETDSGRVTVVLAGEMARQLPEYAEKPLMAHTGCDGDIVYAVAVA